MTAINLLPWREQRRERRRRQFLCGLLLTIGTAAVLVLGLDRILLARSERQQAALRQLQSQLDELAPALAELRQLQQQAGTLRARLEAIAALQQQRALGLQLLEELVRTLPEGLYYERLSRSGDSMDLDGLAASGSRVSQLLQALDASDWFAAPVLQQGLAVRSADAGGEAQTRFRIQLAISPPAAVVQGSGQP